MPLRQLADHNDTAFPVYGSGNTAICPQVDGCCYNPGEDVDGNAVVSASSEAWQLARAMCVLGGREVSVCTCCGYVDQTYGGHVVAMHHL